MIPAGWETIDATMLRCLEERETAARIRAELNTEQLVRVDLGCIRRARALRVGRYVPDPVRRRRRSRR